MIKRILIILFICLSLVQIPITEASGIPNTNTAKFISSNWKTIPLKQSIRLIDIVKANTTKTFPTALDVLAIISIESSFKVRAVGNAGEIGVMQIAYKPSDFNLQTNIRDGVYLLRYYRKVLGSNEAAIHAYNIGIGNYLKGKRNYIYYRKHISAKRILHKHMY